MNLTVKTNIKKLLNFLPIASAKLLHLARIFTVEPYEQTTPKIGMKFQNGFHTWPGHPNNRGMSGLNTFLKRIHGAPFGYSERLVLLTALWELFLKSNKSRCWLEGSSEEDGGSLQKNASLSLCLNSSGLILLSN